MATSFQVVYQRFLNKITDSNLASLPTTNLESIMLDYLQSSIVRFRKCKQDIKNIDIDSQQFNVDLNLDEIEILASWMVYHWTIPQINSLELLRQRMSLKDFASTSQANHLQALLALRDVTSKDVYTLMKYYSYDNNDLTGLAGNGN
jgi:hypothetical protein